MANIVSKTFFWTDSKIDFQWFKLPSSTLHCFVANHVPELQNNTRDIIWSSRRGLVGSVLAY